MHSNYYKNAVEMKMKWKMCMHKIQFTMCMHCEFRNRSLHDWRRSGCNKRFVFISILHLLWRSNEKTVLMSVWVMEDDKMCGNVGKWWFEVNYIRFKVKYTLMCKDQGTYFSFGVFLDLWSALSAELTRSSSRAVFWATGIFGVFDFFER